MRKDMSLGERLKWTVVLFLLNCICLFLMLLGGETLFSLNWFIAVGIGGMLGVSVCVYLHSFEKSEHSTSASTKESYYQIDQRTITFVVVMGAVLTNILTAILAPHYQTMIGTVLVTGFIVLFVYMMIGLW